MARFQNRAEYCENTFPDGYLRAATAIHATWAGHFQMSAEIRAKSIKISDPSLYFFYAKNEPEHFLQVGAEQGLFGLEVFDGWRSGPQTGVTCWLTKPKDLAR